jgi:hypothetical protein
MNTKQQYIYMIRKYVVATSLKSAIDKEKSTPVHDVFLSDGSANMLHEKALNS